MLISWKLYFEPYIDESLTLSVPIMKGMDFIQCVLIGVLIMKVYV